MTPGTDGTLDVYGLKVEQILGIFFFFFGTFDVEQSLCTMCNKTVEQPIWNFYGFSPFDITELLEFSGTLVKVELLMILIAETEEQYYVEHTFKTLTG